MRQHGVLFGAAEFGGEIRGQTDAGPENSEGNRAGQAGGLEQANFPSEGQALEDGGNATVQFAVGKIRPAAAKGNEKNLRRGHTAQNSQTAREPKQTGPPNRPRDLRSVHGGWGGERSRRGGGRRRRKWRRPAFRGAGPDHELLFRARVAKKK